MIKLLLTDRIALIYLLLLLVGALVPLGSGSASLNSTYALNVRGDYLLHALFYIPLPIILLLSKTGRHVHLGWVILFALIMVVMFEGIQMIIPYRAFNINDLFANGVGVLIGLILFALFSKKLLGES